MFHACITDLFLGGVANVISVPLPVTGIFMVFVICI